MAERRQATRREPIEVEVRGEVFLAEPLPWQQGGDLGNEIIRQNLEGLNAGVRLYVQDDIPQLDMQLGQKISDWNAVLKMAYPAVETQKWNDLGLDVDEAATLMLAALEVNHLEHLSHLVDPNAEAPTIDGGINSSGLTALMGAGLKTESSPDSFSTESPAPTSLNSPEENSSPS